MGQEALGGMIVSVCFVFDNFLCVFCFDGIDWNVYNISMHSFQSNFRYYEQFCDILRAVSRNKHLLQHLDIIIEKHKKLLTICNVYAGVLQFANTILTLKRKATQAND